MLTFIDMGRIILLVNLADSKVNHAISLIYLLFKIFTMNKVIVEIRGGVVNCVTTSEKMEITIIDYDIDYKNPVLST